MFFRSVALAFTVLLTSFGIAQESHTVRVNYSSHEDGSFDLAFRHTQTANAVAWDAMKVTLLPSGRVLAVVVDPESPIAAALADQLRTDSVEPVTAKLNEYSAMVTSAHSARADQRINVSFFIGGKEEVLSDAHVPLDRDFWFQTMRDDIEEEVAQSRFGMAADAQVRSRIGNAAGGRNRGKDDSVAPANGTGENGGEVRAQFCRAPRILHCGSCEGCIEQCVCCTCASFALNCLDCTIKCLCD